MEKILERLTCKTVNLDAKVMSDLRKYREAVGSLIYLTTCKTSFEFYSKLIVTILNVVRYLRGTSDRVVFQKM